MRSSAIAERPEQCTVSSLSCHIQITFEKACISEWL